ncbi:MAG: molybdopterin-guanine dinucleotide biosynthesis protein B [Candidatus Bathyarchaeia archaeon]|jgi:molybdopterin-guanine dinucleotide biosynthesis protein MobB
MIAVIGGKHSGKTTIIEHLITELKSRSYTVGAIKEMVRIPTLDTPATETERYRNAGAEVIVAVPREETVVFIKKRLNVREILPFLAGLDYVVLEDFEREQTLPKIIAAKTADEVKSYLDESVIAVSGLITESGVETKKATAFSVPVFRILTQTREIADLVVKEAVTCGDP